MRTPNTIIFGLYPMLDVWQRALYEELFIWTHGFGKNPNLVSQKRVAARLNTSDKQVRKILRQLVEKGLVRTLGSEIGGGNEARGTWMDVWTPLAGESQAGARRTAGGRRHAGEPQSPGEPQPPNKENTKRNMKAPVAVAPAIDVFQIRTIAARLFEAHRGESGFDHDRLRALVEAALVGQGTPSNADLIEEAIRGMVG